MESIFESIRLAIDVNGYYLGRAWTLDRLVDCMGTLGHVKQMDSITPVPGSSIYIRSMRQMPFHNEDPDIGWVAWYCEHSAHDGGDTVLVDGTRLVEKIGCSARSILQKIRCTHRNPTNEPVLASAGRWYFIPWALPKSLDAEALAAVTELTCAIDNIEKTVVPLKEGQVLIIDNRRMLHGRSSFTDRARVLVRVSSIRG